MPEGLNKYAVCGPTSGRVYDTVCNEYLRETFIRWRFTRQQGATSSSHEAGQTNLHNQKDSVFVGQPVNHLIPAVKLLHSTQIPTHLQERRVLSSVSKLSYFIHPFITELPDSAPSGVVQQEGLQESSVVPALSQ